MRLSFFPPQRERKIFMGTLFPTEKKVRDMIQDVVNDYDQYGDLYEESIRLAN